MLMQISNSKLFFEIDDEDFDKINKCKWRVSSYGYIRNSKNVYLHRVLINLCQNFIIDHIDGNRLNNKKENLRLCTLSSNAINKSIQSNNKSGFIGVSFSKRENKFRSVITINKKDKQIGLYTDKILAAQARDKYAILYHKEYAKLNFPEGHENFCKNNIEKYNNDFKENK